MVGATQWYSYGRACVLAAPHPSLSARKGVDLHGYLKGGALKIHLA